MEDLKVFQTLLDIIIMKFIKIATAFFKLFCRSKKFFQKKFLMWRFVVELYYIIGFNLVLIACVDFVQNRQR